ncbi:MAG: VOC family protein [Pleurocapsa minor GSE-CHR-MK-17-07R]|nr:VOC family protein [Pleurocapsa minor GSE-CHR-MK 17-07R]
MTSTPPMLSKLSPMIPAGKDIRAAVDFYEHTLGFTVTYKADDWGMVILQRGEVEIMLANSDDPHTAAQTSFRIQVSDVNALYAEYKAHGIAPFEQPDGAGLGTVRQMPWGTREFPVRDLAGVCITFYERVAR